MLEAFIKDTRPELSQSQVRTLEHATKHIDGSAVLVSETGIMKHKPTSEGDEGRVLRAFVVLLATLKFRVAAGPGHDSRQLGGISITK